jgi:hypothetical protein
MLGTVAIIQTKLTVRRVVWRPGVLRLP